MKYRKNLRLWLTGIIAFLALALHPVAVRAAEAPYTTLTIDKYGMFRKTQDGYTPHTVYDKFGEEQLKNPSDLFLTEQGKMYIADTGNQRVLVCDLNGNLLSIIEGDFKGPTGLYVDQKDNVYVADPKLQKILVYDKDHNLIKSYEQPNSPLFGTGSRYAPSKLVVNEAGGIYALSEGNANGILSFSAEGDFYGYFGANHTSINLLQILMRNVFTEEMLKALQANVPTAALNLDMDQYGLIYTVTQGNEYGGIKKFNMAAKNMLGSFYNDAMIMDIAVGKIENIYTVTKDGYIYEYTRDENLLFLFGGRDDGKKRIGLFTSPSAIDTDQQGRLYVLDSEQGNITVFLETEYARTVHEALNLFQEGYYLESHKPWEEVLKKNSLFDYAHRGIGKAYYRMEEYRQALQAAKLGGDYEGYSDAFWELRNDWVRKNVKTVGLIILLLYMAYRVFRLLKKKLPIIQGFTQSIGRIKEIKLIKQINYIRYVPKNPADAFYGIKFEGKVSILSASLMYLMFFILYVIEKYYSGFLFKGVMDDYYEIGTDLVLVFGFFLLSMICNNLICSIHDGEGSFQNVYCSYAYCLAPYLFLKPAVILLSHVLTFNESFILTFLNVIIYAGMAVLIVVMIKEIQAYNFKQTFKSILLTIFTMLIVVAAGLILFALIKQVMDFIVSIVKEGYYRGR